MHEIDHITITATVTEATEKEAELTNHLWKATAPVFDTVCYDDTPQTALNGLYELLIDALTTGNMKMYANLIPEIKIKKMTAEITLSASQNMTLDVFLDGNEERKE